MQTRIYVDGYNLYYGALKRTPYKWLNLIKLFDDYVLPSVFSPDKQMVLAPLAVKFFTAEIVEKAAQDPDSKKDQDTYHNALVRHCGEAIKIHKGYYSVNKVHVYQVDGNKHPRDCERVEIWKLEEKQSDVNLATEALYDAITQPELEQVVFVSNDTDLAASMIKIREYNNIRESMGWTPVKIGLVIPTRSGTGDTDDETRRVNKTLSDLADWTVDYLRNEWLENSLLPHKVTGGRRPSVIPVKWHPQSELLGLIMDELMLFHTFGEAWKWLETTKPFHADLIDLTTLAPIEVLKTQEGAEGVYAHAKSYTAWKASQ